MSRLMRISVITLGVGLAAGTLPAQQETGGFGLAKETHLSVVRSAPHAFKNVWVKFTGHYLGIGTVHNPFFTRFTRADFLNFAVWGDEQKIWDRPEYDNPCSTLFCAKSDNALLDLLYGLERYQRLEITGVVRNAFQDEPWIEVTEVRPLDGKLTTATLAHMSRAWTLIQTRRWQLAALELSLASSENLTEFTRGWMHGYLGLCFMRLGRPQEAAQQLRNARDLLGEEPTIVDWSETLAKDARGAMDTQVEVGELRRADRPMWEAMEQSREEAEKASRSTTLRPSSETPKPVEQQQTTPATPKPTK